MIFSLFDANFILPKKTILSESRGEVITLEHPKFVGELLRIRGPLHQLITPYGIAAAVFHLSSNQERNKIEINLVIDGGKIL